MGHLGVTEVVLVLGLLTLIFADRIVRWFARRVARTPASSIPAPTQSEASEAAGAEALADPSGSAATPGSAATRHRALTSGETGP